MKSFNTGRELSANDKVVWRSRLHIFCLMKGQLHHCARSDIQSAHKTLSGISDLWCTGCSGTNQSVNTANNVDAVQRLGHTETNYFGNCICFRHDLNIFVHSRASQKKDIVP